MSLTALAEAQGVAPAEDLGSIAALWPADDNPDELLTHDRDFLNLATPGLQVISYLESE